jgi:hypothetical protein
MQVDVMCGTANCLSNGYVTRLENPEPIVICGHCGNEITNKTEVIDAPAEPTL